MKGTPEATAVVTRKRISVRLAGVSYSGIPTLFSLKPSFTPVDENHVDLNNKLSEAKRQEVRD